MKTKLIIATSAVSLFIATSAMAVIIVPPSLPTSVDECKKGGWQNYNGLFKNQGDCVSFVATDGRNLPDGPNAP